ncbi:MAG: CBS domain-containing protein [Nitrospirales bacterium]|nr:MAG: CBS domain-containing protein [Nitrospirales bacterium]
MRKVEWISQRCDPATLVAYQVMEDQVITCKLDDRVLTVGHKMYDGNIGSVPVVDGEDSLVGIVTEFDLLQAIERGNDLRALPVSSIMTTEVVSVTAHTPFMDIVRVLQRHHLVRVPVVREQTLIGILARRDVILGYIKATDVGSGG